MNECIDSFGDATISSTLQDNSSYWKVRVSDENRDKTAFLCHCRLFRFTQMRFGPKNAPETFQRAMDIILSSGK